MQQAVRFDNETTYYEWRIVNPADNRVLVKVGGEVFQYVDLMRTDTALLLLRSVVRGVDQRKENLLQEIGAQRILIEQQNQDLQATKANLTNSLNAIEELRFRIRDIECKAATQADAACLDPKK